MSLLPSAQAPTALASATISPCGRYRYDLARHWGPDPDSVVNFVMLNPSKADAERADATLTRCVNFARTWGYDGLVLTNLYAFRATDPRDLWRAEDPVGPDNDRHLIEHAANAAIVVLAWGANAAKGDRVARVREILDVRPYAIRLTKGGHPEHPLRLPANLTPIDLPWGEVPGA